MHPGDPAEWPRPVFQHEDGFCARGLKRRGHGIHGDAEIGNGLYPGHAELAVEMLRRHPRGFGACSSLKATGRRPDGPKQRNEPSDGIGSSTLLAERPAGRCSRPGSGRSRPNPAPAAAWRRPLTDVPGSSQWFERGYVTYSNAAKIQDLGVEPEVLERHGAVSAAVAEQMAPARCARAAPMWPWPSRGIAGPDGGTLEKPVGTGLPGGRAGTAPCDVLRELFAGDRAAVRRATVAAALRLLAQAAEPREFRRQVAEIYSPPERSDMG